VRTAVDSSCFVAVALRELGHEELSDRLASFDRSLSSMVTEAEVCAVLRRRGSHDDGSRLLCRVWWLPVKKQLTARISRVLDQGVGLKGADVWHLACALCATPRPEMLSFLTLDASQRRAAELLGFKV
jgi:predicted nucleic acid-binding protein